MTLLYLHGAKTFYSFPWSLSGCSHIRLFGRLHVPYVVRRDLENRYALLSEDSSFRLSFLILILV